MVNIDLEKKIIDKELFKKLTNNKFTFFVENSLTELLTIEEFFSEYERLFFSIPIEGTFQSHEYLIKKSSELFNFERDTQDIEPLLNEIAKLRESLLSANRRIITLENELLLNGLTTESELQKESKIGCMDPSDPLYDPLATIPCNDCCSKSQDTSSQQNSSGEDNGGDYGDYDPFRGTGDDPTVLVVNDGTEDIR